MKDDIPTPALRLLCALPVRTHERRYVAHVQGSKAPPPIIINHRRYDSIMDAARKLELSRGHVRRLLRDGKAQYA